MVYMRSMPEPKPSPGKPKRERPIDRLPDGPRINPNIPQPKPGRGQPKPGPKPRTPKEREFMKNQQRRTPPKPRPVDENRNPRNPMESDFIQNEKRRNNPSRPIGKGRTVKQKSGKFSGGTGRMGKSTR